MKSAEQSRAANYILIALTLTALAVVIWRIADVVVVTFGSLVFATALRALSVPLARATRISERWSLGVVILGLLALAGLTAWFFGSQAASQFAELQQQVPAAAKKLLDWLQKSEAGKMAVNSVKNSSADTKALSGVGLAAGALVKTATDVLLIFFLSLYFAGDPDLYLDGAVRLLPVARRAEVKRALIESGAALKKWLLAEIIAMVSVGVLAGVTLALIGVPLALSLGVLAGLLEFVPVVGPVISAIPGLLVAFSKGPEMVVYALLAYIGVQQLESNVIMPIAQRWAVELPPVVALLAVAVFGILFGIVGVVFATPIVVVAMVLIERLYVSHLERPRHVAK